MLIALELNLFSAQPELLREFEQFMTRVATNPRVSFECLTLGVQLFGDYAELTTLCDSLIQQCLQTHLETPFLIKLAGSAHCLPASLQED